MDFPQPVKKLLLFGQSSTHLASNLVTSTKARYVQTTLQTFPDKEMQPVIQDTINGETVFIIQATPSVFSLMELLLTIEATKGAGAQQAFVIAPYLGYTRQDRRFGQSSFGAALVARLLETAGVDKILIVDPHNPANPGFFHIPAYFLVPIQQFLSAWMKADLDMEKMVIATPDAGSYKRALDFSRAIGSELPVIMFKERTAPDQCHVWGLAGSVHGRPVMLVDDMVSSGGTLLQAAQLLQEKGATAVYASATHLVTTQILSQLNGSAIKHLFVSNSLYHQFTHKKVTIVSLVPLLAEAINSYQSNLGSTAVVRSYPFHRSSFISSGNVQNTD